MDLTSLTVHELSALLQKREVSSVEVTSAYLKRIASLNERLGAYITVTDVEAIAAAKEADKRLSSNTGAPLTGVPISVKDIFCTAGVRTTCASKILENFIPAYDAAIVAKLKDAGP